MTKTRDRRHGARWLAASLAVGSLIAGACGSSSKSSTSSTTAAPTTTAATATSSGSSTTASSGGSVSITGTGVTATQIKIGQITTTSGPVPGLFQNANDSLDAFVAYENSIGGIDGHQLVVVHKDDSYNCNNYTNAMKALAASVFAVVGSFTVEDGCGAAVLKANPTFPDLEGYVLDPTLLSLPNVFASQVQPPGFQTVGYQYIKDKYPTAITKSAAIWPTSAQAEWLEQSGAAKSIGFTYVYQRGIGATETNFTSDILRMKSAGVQFVDLESEPVNIITTFIEEAAQQNFKPVAIFGAAAYDTNFFKLLGNSPALNTENIVAPVQWALYLGEDRATTPELNTYLTWLDKLHPGVTSTVYGIAAWSAGVQFVQGIQAAGANVTQSSLIQAVTNMGNFNANGLTPGSDPGKRIGSKCAVIVGVSGTKFVRLSPTTSGFECNGTYFNLPLSALGG